ncbi:MAG: chorismate-binding protein, partial [Halobaculum sp.]
TDEKERAEHAMLVDLERNDLGKVSVPGTVAVSEYRRVDRYASVMHLVSLVEGRERPDRSLADTLAAVFPGGTITGAPKPRTMEIVDELEQTRRGPYTGSVAALGFDGRAVCNILIRTLVRTGGEYTLRVGAGIVHDSDPEREYEETLDKARGLVSALDDSLDASLDVTRRRDDRPTDSTDANSTDTDSPDTDLTDADSTDTDRTDVDRTDADQIDTDRTDGDRPPEDPARSGDGEVRQ